MTDEELMMMIFGSAMYQDPEGMGMPGDEPYQRMNYLQDVESILGVPIVQLMGGMDGLGGQAAPQASYTQQVYGGNPMYAEAFAAIDSGKDPVSVLNALVNAEGDPFGFSQYDDDALASQQAQIGEILEKYAYESVQGRAENADAQAANTFTINNRKYTGSPDITGFANEYELMGAPSVGQMVEQIAQSQVAQRKAAQSPAQAMQTAARESQTGVPFTREYAAAAKASPSLDEREFNPFYEKMLTDRVQGRLTQAQNTNVRSDANTMLMRRAMAMRALLGV
jgi:hypothetical protein